ncbi:MAG TPA: PspC domain-containing protein [Mucilaginibacter sp.]|jgi:phage shock protein PspC (stress-responsive transcriptional regulator)|nr:PspC domain-containing protein [Mucilaginibacter sp.]
MDKKLYRDEYHKVIGGVCAGLGEYFDMDVTIVRLLFCFAFFVMGVGLIPYVILWIVLPRRGYPYNNFNNPTVDYRVPPQQPADGPQSTTPPPSASPYGTNPFANSNYNYNTYSSDTMKNVPPVRQPSNAGVIVGVVLIVIGGIILIDNYDLIPDFDFSRLWPLAIIAAGAALLMSGRAWMSSHQGNLQNAGRPDNSTNTNPPATEDAAAKEE